MKRSTVILAVAALGVAALLWFAGRSGSVVCEACITFEGRTECAKAAGPDRERAMMEATTVVCSRIASGMTDTLRCQSTEPDRASCEGKAAAKEGRY